MKTIIEPFKIKAVEPIRFTTWEEREKILEKAGYNLFNVKSKDVLIDLLTDSGTAAMSAQQWAGIMKGDEAYAGSRSYWRFEQVIKDLTGLTNVIPTHQGRAAEKILFSLVGEKGKIIPNNTHFDTTRANIEVSGAEAVDLPVPGANIPSLEDDFKGNMDLDKLEALFKKEGPERIPLCMLTVTNNSYGALPRSAATMGFPCFSMPADLLKMPISSSSGSRDTRTSRFVTLPVRCFLMLTDAP